MNWNDDLEKAYNEQITGEFASSYGYLALAAWLEERSFPGMAHWMQQQAGEERVHALKLYQFVLDRDGTVALGPIAAPDTTGLEGPLDVFERVLAHERVITTRINELYSLVTDQRDFASLPLLDWFVNEQVEEESTIQQIVDDLRLAGAEGHALLMIDRELGSRTAAAETG